MTRFKQESICLFLCKLFPELDYLCSEIKLFLSILSESASYRSAIGVLPQCVSVYSQMQAGLLDAVTPISPDLWWYCRYHNRANFLFTAYIKSGYPSPSSSKMSVTSNHSLSTTQ